MYEKTIVNNKLKVSSMSSKILNVVLGLTLFISINIANTVNATLIVGDLYADANDIMWEYVGAYDLSDVNSLNDVLPPKALNGLEAAELIFGELNSGSYALSAAELLQPDLIFGSPSYYVTHEAWYDAFQGFVSVLDEDIVANQAGGEGYDAFLDVSALVNDRAVPTFHVNHVFKSATASIPEPTTLSVLMLGLLGLMVRKTRT